MEDKTLYKFEIKHLSDENYRRLIEFIVADSSQMPQGYEKNKFFKIIKVEEVNGNPPVYNNIVVGFDSHGLKAEIIKKPLEELVELLAEFVG